MNLIYKILFLIFTVVIFVKSIAYGLYEIKQQQNRSGGICFITFSLFALVFTNIIVFINL